MSDPEKVSAESITPLDMPEPTSPAPASIAAAPETPAKPAIEAPVANAPVFDPEKHLSRNGVPVLHPKTGRFMPKSTGRKKSAGAPAKTSAQSFIPAVEPKPEPAGSGVPSPEKSITSSSSESATVDHANDAAEVVSRATQFAAGVVLDAPEDCAATPAEHKHMVEATAAYIRGKGWQSAAGVGLFLMFAAWLLKVMQKPGPNEKVRGWLKPKEQPARNVTPQANAQPGQSRPAEKSAVIDIPPHVPPLAPQ